VFDVCGAIACQGEDGWASEGDTKTESSERLQVMHSVLIAELKKWKDEGWAKHMKRQPTDEDRILVPNPKNKKDQRPPSASQFREDLRAAGLPDTFKGENLVFHDCRHSFSTWLKRAGVHLEDRDSLIGHSDGGVTDEHYDADHWEGLQVAIEKIVFLLPEMPATKAEMAEKITSQPIPPVTAEAAIPAELLSRLRDLNSRPTVYETVALPLS